jgi:hypothetical protein
VTNALLAVHVELQLDGLNWTDVTEDVRALDHPFTLAGGIKGHEPTSRSPSIGRCEFALDNSEGNSTATRGYYSPGGVDCRAGFELNVPARVILNAGDTYGSKLYGDGFYGGPWYKFVGKVKSIQVEPGTKLRRKTICIANDFIYEMSRHKMNLLAVQENRRSDLLFGDVYGNLEETAEATEFNEGEETFAYGGDDLRDEGSTALAAGQKIAVSEGGYWYMKGDPTTGGVLVFEGRHHRINSDPIFTLTDTDISQMEVSRNLDDVINEVLATSYPREIGASPEVLYTLQRVIEIGAGETVTFTGRYTDPTARASRVAGLDMITPVVDTDYKFGSSSGGGANDKNADLAVTATYGGNSVDWTLENTSGTTGFLNLLQARGTAVRTFEPAIATAEDAASKTAYGRRVYSLVLPYQDSPLVAADFAAQELALRKSPRTYVEQVTVTGRDGVRMRMAVAGEPGTRITFSETVTELADDYFIQGYNLRIIPPDTIQASFDLVLASAGQMWLLDITGFTELDLTCILGV